MAKTPITQMRIPTEVLKRIDEAATRAGVNRTRWVIEACEARLAQPQPELWPGAEQGSGDVCTHPVTRRLGDHCGLCGVRLGKRR